MKLSAKEFFIKPLITVIAMFASVKLAYGFVVGMIGNSLATIVSIGVGAIVYVVLVFALGVISKEDFRFGGNRINYKRNERAP